MFDRAHILIQGPSGTGKTFIASQHGKPLYAAVEVKCRKVVQRLNPNAKIFPVESINDFDRLISLVQDARLVEQGFTRIVVDSFSELTEYLPTWMQLGFPLQKQHYGQIQNRAMELMLAIQKSPIPSVTICRSVVKEFGDITRVVPGSLGKSAENLPAKCILTAESRHDDEKGWVLDTTPSPYTQRSGLPWVPQIFQGSIDELLATVESTSEETAPTINTPGTDAPVSPTISTDQQWTKAIVDFNEATFKAQWSPEDRKKAHEEWEAKGPAALSQLLEAIKSVNKPRVNVLHTPEATAAVMDKERSAKTRLQAGPSSADLPEVPPPGANDPAWIALMARLAEQTQGRPEQERLNQVAAWGRSYLANPDKAKADLEQLIDATERLKVEGAPDPELDPEGYRKAFSDMCTVLQAEKRAKVAEGAQPCSPAAKFANEVAAGPGRARPEEINELLDLCGTLKVNLDALWLYACEKGGAARNKDGSKDWLTVSADFLARVAPQFKDTQKRIAVISWLHKKYSEVPF